MIKFKYQFMTWAECLYYSASVDGKELPVYIIKSPENRFGLRSINIRPNGNDVWRVFYKLFPNYQKGTDVGCTDINECKRFLQEVANEIFGTLPKLDFLKV